MRLVAQFIAVLQHTFDAQYADDKTTSGLTSCILIVPQREKMYLLPCTA